MPDPWKCPECSIWQAPDVTSHRCAEPAKAETKDEPTTPPGYFGHNAGSFERQPRIDYQPSPRWGFRP